MISAIIFLLAVLTAGAIVGIFAAALVELSAANDGLRPDEPNGGLIKPSSSFSAERS